MEDYANTLSKISVPRHRRKDKDSPLTADKITQLRGVNGGLMWLAGQGQPLSSFEVSRSQGSLSNPTVQSLLDVNHVVDLALQYAGEKLHVKSLKLDCLCLIAVSDASFGNVPGKRSQSGHVILIGDQEIHSGATGRLSR